MNFNLYIYTLIHYGLGTTLQGRSLQIRALRKEELNYSRSHSYKWVISSHRHYILPSFVKEHIILFLFYIKQPGKKFHLHFSIKQPLLAFKFHHTQSVVHMVLWKILPLELHMDVRLPLKIDMVPLS